MVVPFRGGGPIATEEQFADCVVLEADAFDPDRVFHEDIVDDEVLPSLSLAVDGLTDTGRFAANDLELGPEDAANDAGPPARMPDTSYDPEQLEVYGWETSLWRKVISYLRF